MKKEIRKKGVLEGQRKREGKIAYNQLCS